MSDEVRETELQRKIKASLKRHPARLGKNHSGKLQQLKAVAAEVGCSLGAVQHVEMVDRASELGKKFQAERMVPLAFDVPQTADLTILVKDFPGWVFVFGKLSLLVNNYLQIARVMGETMPAAWLASMRDLCENAQQRAEEDARVKKYRPPAGSGNFGHLLEERTL